MVDPDVLNWADADKGHDAIKVSRNMLSIGVVTVLYNSEDVLDGFVSSLARAAHGQGFAVKLYCIDNSRSPVGTDLARDLCEAFDVDAHFVFNDRNVGVAAGNNQGIRLALEEGCTHVLLANNDIEFGATAILHLAEALARRDAIAAVPKITFHGSSFLWYAGGSFDWKARTFHVGCTEEDTGAFDAESETGYAPTCFMLVDASAFSQVGYMDEAYFCYYDDSDFVWRMTQRGLRLIYVPASAVSHKVSTSTGGDMSSFSLYYLSRNRVYFIRKHLTGLNKPGALLHAAVGSVRTTIRMIRSGMPSTLWSRLWIGFLDGLKMPVCTG